MRKGATVNAEDNHLRTPLHYATMTNSTALVRSLLAAGASASMEDEDGQPPSFYASPNSEIQWLLLWGTTTEARNTHGRTALCEFARLGATNVVRGLLGRGANVEALGPHNRTPLHEAAGGGHVETCAALVEAGAPVNAATLKGVTPLIAAGTGGHTRVISLLLAHGADVNATQENDFTAIGEAACHGHVAAVEVLLNARANAGRGSAFHPLLRAASAGHVAVMALLLDRGRVNINQRSWQQKTALIEAAFVRRVESARLLVERGANVRMRDEFGKSAFFWAVANNCMPLVELLLRRDAEGVRDLRDNHGVSPRGVAVQNGLTQMARFLEERGAVL
ncbi:ankyrin repeat-containing domain protein [Phyllosticta citribraziliensis]|uniref:Ankyrin repeat-containing domain protein n=1 Tax=Phyllosticta citribraziliensis TaxID=989973 RepID=A0ABR1M1R8_9PEZI